MGEKTERPAGFQLVGDPHNPEAEGSPGSAAHGSLPPITFGAFVLSLSSSAAIHLGAAAPEGVEGEEKPEPNLALARQVIDILEMLQIRTRGNLAEDEQKLLDGVVHDLHLRFVEARKRQG